MAYSSLIRHLLKAAETHPNLNQLLLQAAEAIANQGAIIRTLSDEIDVLEVEVEIEDDNK